MNTLRVVCEDIAVVIAAGYTTITIYTDTSETGTFVTVDGTVTLVAGTESYLYTDVDGTLATWYRTSYTGAGVSESTKSAARRSDTSSAYGTLDELRPLIGLRSLTDDVELALLLDTASTAINRYCNRLDGFIAPPNATIRYYLGTGTAFQNIDECVSITAVAVKDSSTDTTYTAWTSPTTNFAGDGDWIPYAGDHEFPEFNRLPFTGLMVDPNGDNAIFTSGQFASRRGFRPTTTVQRGLPTVRVTARWGFASTIPSTIKTACIMQAARWYKRLEGGMADSLANPEVGGRLRFTQRLDPDVEWLLKNGRYFKPAVG